jgi:hypothetical protein
MIMDCQISRIQNRNLYIKYAEVVELLDKLDSKSSGAYTSCRFTNQYWLVRVRFNYRSFTKVVLRY